MGGEVSVKGGLGGIERGGEMGGGGVRAISQQISGNQKVNRHPVLEHRSTYWRRIADSSGLRVFTPHPC